MRAATPSYRSPINAVLADVEARWQKALPFFQRRRRVIFLSYNRFWEKHAFVQQSLARTLIESGVEVHWLDGTGWRPYEPTLYWQSPALRVRQLFEPPGQRFARIKRWTTQHQAKVIQHLAGQKENTLIWIQAGIEELLAERLFAIDVFSTFDDMYRHDPSGPLCQRAKLILCQNTPTFRRLATLGKKAQRALPPVDISKGVFEKSSAVGFPAEFPKQRMGYIGSFFAKDYDLVLFEDFVRSFPQFGFFLAGRTDPEGEDHLKRLSQYENFIYFPWLKRSQIAPLWKNIHLNLLFYRPFLAQDGAFPTKILEAMHFGVPSIATKVPKTEDLAPFCSRSSFPDELKRFAIDLLGKQTAILEEAYAKLLFEMHPKVHLARVAEAL